MGGSSQPEPHTPATCTCPCFPSRGEQDGVSKLLRTFLPLLPGESLFRMGNSSDQKGDLAIAMSLDGLSQVTLFPRLIKKQNDSRIKSVAPPYG